MTVEKFVAAALVGIGLGFIFPVFSALIGGFTGWVVGLFFGEVIIGFLGRIGVDIVGLEMWHVGMSLGFIGGFLRTTVTTND